ncbi:MAG: BtpA/SgcQ family protein [Promethearchaeota archaeon]
MMRKARTFREMAAGGFFIIGMLHCPPLPGSPRCGERGRGDLDAVIERVVDDLAALKAGGVDGVLLENFGDAPFHKGSVPPETVASMTAVAGAVRAQTSLPVGVNVLRNDPISALAIARVVGCQFIRVNVHMGVYDTDQGRVEGRAAETLRYRESAGKQIAILTDARVKHARLVAPFGSLEEEVETLVKRGLSDGVILTGRATGQPVDLAEVERVTRMELEVPVIVGSGVDEENLPAIVSLADGVIVGSSIKEDGIVTRPVDRRRVEKLVQLAVQLSRGH